ncbi:hypothetical protein HDU81_006944 [Chytriomyces hyalinus]|nr:hypothetical protein HDU81_006944 [Chytriomyces hyalinus]
MLCDYDQLETVKNYNLCVTKNGRSNVHYTGIQIDTTTVKGFHGFITGFDMVDHINRYPLDNRKCNLRQTTVIENNRNRTNLITTSTDVTGVTFQQKDEAWRARIKIKGIESNKQFSVKAHGYENAKQLAIKWRQDMAKLHNNFISKPNEQNVNRHPDYERLRSEYEDIMNTYIGTEYKWHDNNNEGYVAVSKTTDIAVSKTTDNGEVIDNGEVTDIDVEVDGPIDIDPDDPDDPDDPVGTVETIDTVESIDTVETIDAVETIDTVETIQTIDTVDTVAETNINESVKVASKKSRFNEESREKIRQSKLGSNNPMYGTTWTDERREQFSQRMCGPGNHNFGEHLSQTTKYKLSAKLTGRVIDAEWKAKISNSMKGVPKSAETIEKMKVAAKNRPKQTASDESKANMKEAQQKRRNNEKEQGTGKRTRKGKEVLVVSEIPAIRVIVDGPETMDTIFNDDANYLNHIGTSSSFSSESSVEEYPVVVDEPETMETILNDEANYLNHIGTSSSFSNESSVKELVVVQKQPTAEQLQANQNRSIKLKQYYKENPRPFTPRGRTERDPNLNHKICANCKLDKPIDEYCVKNDTADGFQSNCKQCIIVLKQKSRQKVQQSGTTFGCDQCTKTFALKDSLTRHKKEKHTVI